MSNLTYSSISLFFYRLTRVEQKNILLVTIPGFGKLTTIGDWRGVALAAVEAALSTLTCIRLVPPSLSFVDGEGFCAGVGSEDVS